MDCSSHVSRQCPHALQCLLTYLTGLRGDARRRVRGVRASVVGRGEGGGECKGLKEVQTVVKESG